MAQFVYKIKVVDSKGNAPASASATFLDANKQPILVNGQPVFVVEFYNAQGITANQITSEQNPLNVKICAPGLACKIVTLSPGETTITLDSPSMASVKQNGKWILLVLLAIVVAVIVYLIYKHGLPKIL